LRALIIAIALGVVVGVTSPRLAAANKSVGVLVTGEYLKSPTQQQAEKWLRDRGHKVVTNAMPAEAVKTLLDCFVLDDPKCMRGIVDARATTPVLVSIRLDVASKKQKEIRVTIDWFAKGHSPVSSRRTCDDCTEPVLRSTIDTMLDDLAQTAPGFTGALKITSTPDGITVLLDNKTIGVTPLETTVPIGSHKLKLVRDGRTGPEKVIDVAGDDKPVAVVLDAPATGPATVDGDNPNQVQTTPIGRRSRLVPGLMIGIGLAGVGAGAALYFTSEEPTGNGRTYRDTKNLGIGVAAGGGALLITGVIIILATKSTTGPTVSMTPGGGATVGWAGSF
jgi:hypothetical protein